MLDSFSKKTLIVEGNIGAGKSTFLKVLKDKLKVDIIFEPTDKWQNADGGNLLDLFYKDTKRWAYTFQSYAFVTRAQSLLQQQTKASGNNIQVLERSVYCDRYCFAKNCFEAGHMSAMEWQIYKEWFGWLVEGYMQKPDGFIYLQVDPKVCHKRLLKRNRSEEAGVPLSYLQQLHGRHEDWLIGKKDLSSFLRQVPILILNCDKSFENDLHEQQKHIIAVQNFIDTLHLEISQEKVKSSQLQM